MPHFRSRIGRDGPINEVTVWVGSEQAAKLLASGRAVPPPRTIAALIDTGAERAAIDSHLIDQFGLPSTESVTLQSSALGAEPMEAPVYDVQMSFGAIDGSLRPRWRAVYPVGVSIVAQGALALIGRDMLATSLMIYDG